MSSTPHLSNRQAQEIMHLIGRDGDVHVALVNEYNHVYRIECRGEVFFLKTHTKDWYPSEDAETGYSVAHEHSAFSVLAANGLATPEVLLACRNRDNPFGRPFILTRKLRGEPLTQLLKQSDEERFRALLMAAGEYLRRVHAITFAFPGYIMDSGPTAPPDENAWQHPIWTAKRRQKNALAMLREDATKLPGELVKRLEVIFATMEDALASAYNPPHFAHGDCHAHQFFLYQEAGRWQVSGFIDMEVASAGDCTQDLVTFATEMARDLPITTRWWEPFFAGYDGEPDFELFRLRFLGTTDDILEFVLHWRGTKEEFLMHVLSATDWETLFSKLMNEGYNHAAKEGSS